MNRQIRLWSLLLVAALCLVACDKERKSSGGGEEKEGQEDPVSAEVDENGNVIQNGTKIELAELEKRVGVDPESTTPAAGDGKGAPPDNWLFDGSTGNGHFLLAGASRPNAAGGDILRRIDLDDLTEHDFNDQLPGTQGLYIEVPSDLHTNWNQKGQQSDFQSGLFIGTICDLIPGPDGKVIALAQHGAMVLDPYTDAQAVKPSETIFFVGGLNVCKGVYSRKFNKLYAFNTSAVEKRGGQEGIYVAEIGGGGSKVADLYIPEDGYAFNEHSSNSFDDAAIYDSTLYLTEDGARFSANWDVGVHMVPLSDKGDPLFDKGKKWRTDNPIVRGCGLTPDNTAGVEVIKLNGKPVVLSGGSAGVMAYDLSQDPPAPMDLDGRRPGTQPLVLTDYGRGAPEIAYAPDGKSVFVMPYCKTEGVYEELGGEYGRVEKHQIVELDISGDSPLPKALDAGYLALQKELAASLRPSYMPKFVATFRDMAVGPGHVGIVGAGKSGASGLGSGADMIIIDRASGETVPFAEAQDKATAHRSNYGFPLGADDPEFSDDEQTVHAIMWMPSR